MIICDYQKKNDKGFFLKEIGMGGGFVKEEENTNNNED